MGQGDEKREKNRFTSITAITAISFLRGLVAGSSSGGGGPLAPRLLGETPGGGEGSRGGLVVGGRGGVLFQYEFIY